MKRAWVLAALLCASVCASHVADEDGFDDDSNEASGLVEDDVKSIFAEAEGELGADDGAGDDYNGSRRVFDPHKVAHRVAKIFAQPAFKGDDLTHKCTPQPLILNP